MTDIPLSPIDHIFTGVGSYPIEFVFAYGSTLDAGRLEESLVETLTHFPVVRSKLKQASEYSYTFCAADDGARFETVTTSKTFDDLEGRPAFLDSVNSVEGEPLARLKLSQTPKGSVLGASISHALVDGFSYFYFLSSWARVYNGKPVLRPSHARSLLIPDRPAAGGTIAAEDVFDASGLHWGERRRTIAKEELQWDRWYFSEQEMKELLREAKEACEARLSYNDVITAWLWKRYLGRWDTKSSDGMTYLSCPVDFRRIVGSFPRTYFGCAVILATAELGYDAVADAPIGRLALEVRDAVASVDEDYVRKGLDLLEALRRQEGLSVVEECHVIHPHSGILVTNLSRLPVYDLAFDAGPPVAFDIFTSAPGGAVVLPAPGGVDVRVCSPTSTRDRD